MQFATHKEGNRAATGGGETTGGGRNSLLPKMMVPKGLTHLSIISLSVWRQADTDTD